MHPTRRLSIIDSRPTRPDLTVAVVHDAPRQKTARDLLRALEEDLATDRAPRRPISHRELKPLKSIQPAVAQVRLNRRY